METRRLPIGISDYKKMIDEGYYYVDKTDLIGGLLDIRGEVNLFTRPRRFGKTLMMDMLRAFFAVGSDGALFEGLKVAEDRELWDRYMGKYPVVSISLKGVSGGDYAEAR
ncbi:MAG: AAA family ATPase, partial [Parabacteroides distasonis]|nr:AAA family ATPase [Parabacteroides distasonis]